LFNSVHVPGIPVDSAAIPFQDFLSAVWSWFNHKRAGLSLAV